MKHTVLVARVVCFAGVQMLAPTVLLADVRRCKIDGYNENIVITTSPDTNKNDGQYARIGTSPGVGDRAIVFADRMGAHVFVELNTDGTPMGLLTVQTNMRAIKSVNRSFRHGLGTIPERGRVYSMRCQGLFALTPPCPISPGGCAIEMPVMTITKLIIAFDSRNNLL